VVKPIDGGGGLGVFLATTFDEVEAALIELQTVTNYDGAQFRGICIEEYIPGTEYSVQGLVHGGRSTILTFCKKWIAVEPVKSVLPLRRFREVCHIAVRGDRADAEVKHLTQACVDMFGYQNGPFHIDMVRTAHGYYHLEMGFRLSGAGLVRLVERVSGYDWGEEAFALHLGKSSLQGAGDSESPRIAQLTAVLPTEIENARLLQQQGHEVEIQSFNVPLEKATSQRLKSDLIRHTGVVGRIAIAARTIEEVEGLLHSCSPNLAEKPVFV
jgi:biotin carboxylase